MIRALLKKQLLELTDFIVRDRKNGKRRSKGGILRYALLYLIAFASLAIMFFGIADTLGKSLLPAGLDWLYFAIMGLMTIMLGTFGSAFMTYAGLYRAKDNDLLLSMPIPAGTILLVRLLSVYLTSMLYSALVWIPTMLQYAILGCGSLVTAVDGILLLIAISAFVTVLSCALGWVVALVSVHAKNKSVVTVVLSLAIFGLYYYVTYNMNQMLTSFLMHQDEAAQLLRTWLYPFYLLGRGASGDIFAAICFTMIAAALLILCFFVLARSFRRIVTSNRGAKKAVYREKTMKNESVEHALLRREWKRFLGSSIYLLNCGFGVPMMLLVTVMMFLKRDSIDELIGAMQAMNPQILKMLPAFITAVICFGVSANPTTAPSVSLEGKTFWILRSLPVSAKQVFHAKLKLHLQLNVIPAVFCILVLNILMGGDILSAAFGCLAAAALAFLTGTLGLVLDLNRPNLTWTREAFVVKQNVNVMIALFSGVVVAALIGFGGTAFAGRLPCALYLLLCALFFAGIGAALYRKLMNRGAAIFDAL